MRTRSHSRSFREFLQENRERFLDLEGASGLLTESLKEFAEHTSAKRPPKGGPTSTVTVVRADLDAPLTDEAARAAIVLLSSDGRLVGLMTASAELKDFLDAFRSSAMGRVAPHRYVCSSTTSPCRYDAPPARGVCTLHNLKVQEA